MRSIRPTSAFVIAATIIAAASAGYLLASAPGDANKTVRVTLEAALAGAVIALVVMVCQQLWRIFNEMLHDPPSNLPSATSIALQIAKNASSRPDEGQTVAMSRMSVVR